MKLYKLTDKRGESHNHTTWGEGVTHQAQGEGTVLCTDAVIHAYDSAIKAALFNLIHASFPDPILWEAEGEVVADDGLKVGCKELTTLRRIPLPEITTEQRVEFAIRCARQVYQEQTWIAWADGWLSGADRSAESTRSAAESARSAAESAAWSAAESAESAAESAESAARSAESAAWSAESAASAARSAGEIINSAIAETFASRPAS